LSKRLKRSKRSKRPKSHDRGGTAHSRRPRRNAQRPRAAHGTRRDEGAIEGQLAESTAEARWQVRDASGAVWHLDEVGEARSGDRVLVLPHEGARAELLHVLDGAREHWVGILHRRGGMTYATPYRDEGEWWLRVASPDTGDAQHGEVVELVPALRRGGRRPRPGEAPWARVTRRLGRPGEPDADFAAVVWRHRLPVEFPDGVLAEVSALEGVSDPEETSRRADLRALPFVTIDPEDARDFDDAVHAEWSSDGVTRLWVAVADVAHYVREGSALDREALRRGNSVYFPDRAIPMLPPRLSSDLCSLRPDCERLALVALLELDGQGRTRRASFHTARIRSHARLSYREAQDQLDGASGPHAPMLSALARWASLRTRERRARGGLDFELPGVEIGFDAARAPNEVRRALRSDAHRLVEEAMLAANQAVAEWLCADAVPVPYRNHEAPRGEAAELLGEHLRALGLVRDLPDGPLSSRMLARALARTPEDQVPVVHNLVLRQLRQARYGAASVGHFALALAHYLHFTSPIRRYADLAVHRAVKQRLAGEAPRISSTEGQRVAARASFRERIAQRAEREMLDLARCAFLRAHVGEEHAGRVSGLGRAGLFVTLDAWPIDGLVRAGRLGGAEPDALGHTLYTRAGRRFRLGDRLRVRIAAVDVVRARVDLELLESPAARRPRRGEAQSRPGGAVRGASKRGAGRSRSRAPATQ